MAASARLPHNPILAAVRFAGLIACVVAGYANLLLVRPFHRPGPARRRLQERLIHRWLGSYARIFGFRVTVEGAIPHPSSLIPATGGLLAPNHLGYADIAVMASIMPCQFVTRGEFLRAPVAGRILRDYGVPAVERARTRGVSDLPGEIAERLRTGTRLCVFLEGTSTGGDRVLPFRSPILQGVVAAGAPVIPVAILWSHADPRALIAEDLAYWKDHEMLPHVWRLLGLRGFAARVILGQPIPTGGDDRKQAAAAAREAVVALTGLPAMGPEAQ